MIVAVEAIQPFFSICDSYTSVFIYGMDGLYRAGKMADIMNNPSFRIFFEGGIAHLRDEIMITASGDLSHPILDLGIDEIGVLGKELDALRTPLTILNGYLEVLKLGGSRNIRKLKVIRLLKECEKNDRRNWCSHDCERGHSIFYGGNRVFRERIKHIPDCISSGMC